MQFFLLLFRAVLVASGARESFAYDFHYDYYSIFLHIVRPLPAIPISIGSWHAFVTTVAPILPVRPVSAAGQSSPLPRMGPDPSLIVLRTTQQNSIIIIIIVSR